jgi:hypothetical protein
MKKILREIQNEIGKLDMSVLTLVKFGFVVGGIPGLLLFAFGALRPTLLRGAYKAWMILALVIGFFVSNVIIMVLYIFLVTPIGLLMNLIKGNPLDQKGKEGSYWVTRATNWDKASMERLF